MLLYIVFALSLALCVVVAVLGAVTYSILLQNGRLIVRLESLEALLRLPEESSSEEPEEGNGLPRGTVVLDFDLPSAWGGRLTRSQLHGRPVLLVFIQPDCPFTERLLAALASVALRNGAARPELLLVGTGDPQANRSMLERHSLSTALVLQEDWEVAALYQVHGTPMGYLIDERGANASGLIAGPAALIWAWVSGTTVPDEMRRAVDLSITPRFEDALQTANAAAPAPAAGSVAPTFSLPDLEGGQLTLEQYRGRPVVVVFADPACAACQALAPALKEAQRRSAAVQLVLVSRRDRQANVAWGRDFGLDLPIGLQQHWEISRRFGTLATPAAVLIDELGLIRDGPVEGAGASLSLLERAQAGSGNSGRTVGGAAAGVE